ncbi:MAG TPA: aryl-sulfate sulfotransferase, partial [Polyangiaceae bacterium]
MTAENSDRIGRARAARALRRGLVLIGLVSAWGSGCSSKHEEPSHPSGGNAGTQAGGRSGAGGGGGALAGGSGEAGEGGTAMAGAQSEGGSAEAGDQGEGGTAAGAAGQGNCGPRDLSCKTLVSCAIAPVTATLSTVIPSVAAITFTTDFAPVDGGFIQFGVDADYTLEAPLDLAATNYRTLLLGMRPHTSYGYRIVLTSGDTYCEGGEGSIVTGALPSGTPADAVIAAGPSTQPIAPGFVVTSQLAAPWLFILDDAGHVVWSYKLATTTLINNARMSYDGKFMYAFDRNETGVTGQGRLYKLAMDGTGVTAINLPTSHHAFAPLPDGSIAYISKNGSDGNGTKPCNAIRILQANGSDTLLVDLWPALSSFDSVSDYGELCHVNAIEYNAADETLTVSDLYRDVFLKFTRAGHLVWSLGGSTSDFAVDLPWDGQYGHHMISPNSIVFFNNWGPPGTAKDDPRALEFSL